MNEPIRIRQLDGAQILESMNCVTIVERFFNRSRAWFIQRLNNNIDNGKSVSFSPEELLTLRKALKILASEINQFSNNIPNIPTAMAIKVYVITDRGAIDYMEDNDIEGFKEYLAENDTFYFEEPKYFDTEEEARAFCYGIGYGMDERAPAIRYPLCSCSEYDLPFIEALENF